jgi:TPR repeat protein
MAKVFKDDAESIKWYLQAAQEGHADAQNNLGLNQAEAIRVS